MSKLIKPARIDEILANGRVIRSLNESAMSISGLSKKQLCAMVEDFDFRQICGVRRQDGHPAGAIGHNPFKFACNDVPYCRKCFLNANNYLNIHKYIKHIGKNLAVFIDKNSNDY